MQQQQQQQQQQHSEISHVQLLAASTICMQLGVKCVRHTKHRRMYARSTKVRACIR